MKKDSPALRYARRAQAGVVFFVFYMFFVVPGVIVLQAIGFSVSPWIFAPMFVGGILGHLWTLDVKCPDCGTRISDFWGRWPPRQMPYTNCKECGRSTSLPYEE